MCFCRTLRETCWSGACRPTSIVTWRANSTRTIRRRSVAMPKQFGCWRGTGFPDRVFAFSADGVWRKSAASRSVSDDRFFRSGVAAPRLHQREPLQLGTAAPDVHRADRDRRFWMGLHRWHLTMPWFEMLRLPAAFVGGELCWRGDVLWEGADEHFTPLAQRRLPRRSSPPMPAAAFSASPSSRTRWPCSWRRPGRCGCSNCGAGALALAGDFRRGDRAGALPGAAHAGAVHPDRARGRRDRHRRRELPRRRAAVRRRRRRAVL